MSEINIKDIAGLYDEFYFLENVVQKEAQINEKKDKNLLITHKKGSILTLVFENDSTFTDADKLMLDKLVQAGLKLSWDKINTCSLSANRDFTLAELIDTITDTRILLWHQTAEYATHSIHAVKQKHMLVALQVHAYHQDKEAKTILWQQLQKLMSL